MNAGFKSVLVFEGIFSKQTFPFLPLGVDDRWLTASRVKRVQSHENTQLGHNEVMIEWKLPNKLAIHIQCWGLSWSIEVGFSILLKDEWQQMAFSKEREMRAHISNMVQEEECKEEEQSSPLMEYWRRWMWVDNDKVYLHLGPKTTTTTQKANKLTLF